MHLSDNFSWLHETEGEILLSWFWVGLLEVASLYQRRNWREACMCVWLCGVCVHACWGMLRWGAPEPFLRDNMWPGFILQRTTCLAECSQVGHGKWLWEVGKVFEREMREMERANAMRSGTLRKKYLKRISRTSALLCVKWLPSHSSPKL